jgi:hypothetical protein
MTSDDIRKLIGGYATGTLTESERKLLFEAALDDQELFNDLAREQSLKEMLDEPGAKQRLISQLAEPRLQKASWKGPMAWWATAAVAGVAAAMTIVWMRPFGERASQPVEVAETKTAPSVAPVLPPAVVPQNVPAPALVPAPRRQGKSAPAAAPDVSTAIAEQKAESGDSKRPPKDAAQADASPRTEAEKPKPAPQMRASAGLQTSDQAQVQAQAATPGPSAAPQPAQAEPLRSLGFRAGAVGGMGGGARAPVAAKAQRPGFGFSYAIDDRHDLTITSATGGYLAVTAAGSNAAIFPVAGDGRVLAGSSTHIPIPSDVRSVVIVFAARPNSEQTQTAPSDGIHSISGPFVGAVQDPNPSPDSRLRIELPIR